jgi:hypothetical protein
MLEDVQERLVYRTHIYIKEEIRDFNPSNGDVAYPEKLEIMEKIAAQLADSQNTNGQVSLNRKSESASSTEATLDMINIFKDNHVSPADVHGMWFPTVRRTLICLSKLYRCLDVSIYCFLKLYW